jgi:phosphohistidine phosphatase SixA
MPIGVLAPRSSRPGGVCCRRRMVRFCRILPRSSPRIARVAALAGMKTIIARWRQVLLAFMAAAFAIGIYGASDGQANEAVWRNLREGGHLILIRHALAPGTGDPAGFVLENCATQRNLSAEGRAQARRLGEMLAANQVPIDRILSSRWCRALETARLMDLGPVEPFAPLDSFFANPGQGPGKTAAVRMFAQGLGDRTIIMVTHQVNITALTGIYPRSGEMIIARPGGDRSDELVVVDRIQPD